MLFEIDSQYGHVVRKDGDDRAVYVDDGTPVDPRNPRPCLGCGAKIKEGEHDPCIANLPGTQYACCGHGLDRAPRHGAPNGYVSLQDGRCFRFSGCTPAHLIKAAVHLALAGQALPDGFEYEAKKAWWEGLTEAQKAYVIANIPRELARLVRESGCTPNALPGGTASTIPAGSGSGVNSRR
jgi:hypothetical protein